MKIVDMTATGDDNILSYEEKHDLEYRRLQQEVVDIEEMSGGISIMDLGLNEFCLDVQEYLRQHPELEQMPLGSRWQKWSFAGAVDRIGAAGGGAALD